MRLPTPPEIADAPELAALASADRALELMSRSLVAAHPELVNQEASDAAEPHRLREEAEVLIRHAAALGKLIERYARLLERGSSTDCDDSTF